MEITDRAGLDVCARLRRALPPEARSDDTGEPDVRYEVRPRRPGETSGYLVTQDGLPRFIGPTVLDVVRWLRSDVDFQVAVQAREGLFVHAGVVGWRDRAILVPGRSMKRMVDGGAEWVCTRRPTLLYNADTSGQKEFLRRRTERT